MHLRKITISLATISLVLIVNHPSVSQELKEDGEVKQALALVQSWLEAQQAYEEIPGLSASILYDEELIWSGAYGKANPQTGMDASSETIHSICSISKLFTSISIMQLQEQGKLRLDDPIVKYLPWFGDLDQQFEDAPPVTIEGILTHSAGLPRESKHPYWTGEFQFPTKELIIEGLKEQQTLYEPWQYFQYSNLGLTLAGQIVEAISGMKYEDYVKKNILEPLKLANTYPYMPEDLFGTKLAVGYTAMTRDGDRKPLPFFEAKGIAPAAGFSSTVDDLSAFASWQLQTYHGNDAGILKRNTLRNMYRVHYMDPNWRTSWGIGFSVREMNGKTIVGHGGSCPGYRSQLLIEPEGKIAVAFMANANGVNTGKFVREIYEIMAPSLKSASKRDPEDSQDDKAVDLTRFGGTYSSLPWGGESLIFQKGEDLASVGFPTDDPSDYTKWKYVSGNRFRRVRSDDSLGEKIEFKEDAEGDIIGYEIFNNFYPKVK